MAHGSRGEELSTTGTEELELLSEESEGGAGLWQNLGPMMILGCGILSPSERLSQQ